MAKRVADGDRIYNEAWDDTTRGVFFWLLFQGSDSLGMQAERPAAIAETLSEGRKHPVKEYEVRAALEVLAEGEKPAIIRYEMGGRRFLVFRRWQDHQTIHYDVLPQCPMPPEEVLARLSAATRQLIVSNFRVAERKASEKLARRLRGGSRVSPEVLQERPRACAGGAVSVPVSAPGSVAVGGPLAVPPGCVNTPPAVGRSEGATEEEVGGEEAGVEARVTRVLAGQVSESLRSAILRAREDGQGEALGNLLTMAERAQRRTSGSHSPQGYKHGTETGGKGAGS